MARKLPDLQHVIRVRKHNRDRKRSLKQGFKARREARAVRKLRAAVKRVEDRQALPRVLYDATTVGNLPAGSVAVAGYVNGIFDTFPALGKLFPKAKRVSIAVSSSANAAILDVEPGDATNADAARWFHRDKDNRGFYTSASNADALVAVLAAAGIARHEYVLWTAHYGAGKHICGPTTCGLVHTSVDATQWTTHDETLDQSVVKPSFWRRG